MWFNKNETLDVIQKFFHIRVAISESSRKKLPTQERTVCTDGEINYTFVKDKPHCQRTSEIVNLMSKQLVSQLICVRVIEINGTDGSCSRNDVVSQSVGQSVTRIRWHLYRAVGQQPTWCETKRSIKKQLPRLVAVKRDHTVSIRSSVLFLCFVFNTGTVSRYGQLLLRTFDEQMLRNRTADFCTVGTLASIRLNDTKISIVTLRTV